MSCKSRCAWAGLFLCLFSAALAARDVSPANKGAGFVALFDGKTLDGWHVMGTPGWTVRDGVIAAPGKGSGWLRSDKEYDNFVLRLEFKNSPRGNSGVFIRAGDKGRTSRTGMEIQIFDDAGKEPNKNSSGSLYDMVPPTKNAAKPAGEWSEYEITANGTRIQVKLNGEIVQDVRTDDPAINAALEKRVASDKARYDKQVAAAAAGTKAPRPLQPFPLLKERRTKGYIGLQNHGTPVEFRNVRIKELR
jgi:hypothetical protein